MRLEILNRVPAREPASSGELLDAARRSRAGQLDSDALPTLAASLVFEKDRAFWINVYNALVIHAALHFGVRETVKEVPGFFRRAAYRIGDHDLSLDDIEHGILRGNRGHPRNLLLPRFAPWDPRRALVLRPVDVRVHFALNCGAASCPPIRHYSADALDEQLELAARGFVNGGGVAIDGEGLVVLSAIFGWFWRDFGLTRRRQLARVWRWIDEDRCDELEAASLKGIRYGEYDWRFA